MRVTSLTTSGFRNLEGIRAEFAEGVNIFYGDNGSGKTNLLEAVFVLCLGRSQRGAPDRVMLGHGEDVYRLEGGVELDEQAHTVAVAHQRGAAKRVTLDGVGIRTAELYDLFCAVSSGPEDSAIVSGSPAERRGFLDIYLSQFSLGYLAGLSDYQRALAQRNAALKAQSDTSAYDELLIRFGASVMTARAAFVQKLAPLAGGFYEDIAGDGGLLVEYHPSIAVSESEVTPETIRCEFERKLERVKEREYASGMSLAGPHRDELYLAIGELPARTFGSQGEWRTAAVALKLAVYRLLAEKKGHPPALLLDEIFAELDARRRDALIGSFGELGQVFLTTAGEPPASLQENSRRFKMAGGGVEEIR